MKTGTSAHYRNLAIALVAGVGLAAASIYLTGVIAALPIPRLPEHFRHDRAGVLIVTLELVGALPLTLIAWMAGRLLFRVLQDSSRQLGIAIGLPWVIYECIGAVEYLHSSGYETSRALSIIFSPMYLTAWVISILSVPAGLWWASRYRQGRARS